jgi:hypothetical protein
VSVRCSQLPAPSRTQQPGETRTTIAGRARIVSFLAPALEAKYIRDTRETRTLEVLVMHDMPVLAPRVHTHNERLDLGPVETNLQSLKEENKPWGNSQEDVDSGRPHGEILGDEAQGIGRGKEGRLWGFFQSQEAQVNDRPHTPTSSYFTGSNLPSVRMSDWLYGEPVELNRSCAARGKVSECGLDDDGRGTDT